MMAEEMGDDMSIDNASEDGKAILECGYKYQYYTIKEVKEMFKFAKARV
jgi:hypothetical protein